MATKLIRQPSTSQVTWTNSAGNTTISSQAMQAWSRIPSSAKIEILNAVEQPSSTLDASVKSVTVGGQTLMVKKISSGFKVLYEPGTDRNTIVSVLTPREAGLLEG